MKLKTTAVVTFGAGAELGLSKDQAKARAAFLVPIAGKDGWYTTKAQVQFKAGELIEYAGDLPKGQVTALSTPSGAPLQAKAATRRKLVQEPAATAAAQA